MAVHSVSRNFVILVFKGTSPFDLTEWLTDASMRKSSARNGVLPGLVHTGFYTNFEFPSQDYIERPTLPIDHAFKSSMESGVPIDISTLWRGIDDVNSASEGGNCRHMWSDCLYPHLLAIRSQFPSGTKPNFWVTGHSLGAATATIFSSTLLWKRTQIGMNTTVPTMDWDKCFNIHGTYTFGTPRVADTDFQQAIVKAMHETSPKFQFYRVINANDIVCSVPGLSKKLGAFLRKRKRLPLSRRHRHSEQDELRPAGVTLSDFQHVGVAVYVGFRDGSIAYRGRDISDVVWNMGKEVLVSLWEIVGERGTVADKLWKVGVVTTGGVASLLRDHMPSEYLKNLKIAESKNPKGPHVDENALHF
ncbi:class 3-domain-containing protein [Chytridium lagenaria]|nr:class 3-domain-containing protein [Chytridium lagenaria]